MGGNEEEISFPVLFEGPTWWCGLVEESNVPRIVPQLLPVDFVLPWSRQTTISRYQVKKRFLEILGPYKDKINSLYIRKSDWKQMFLSGLERLKLVCA